MAKINRFNGNLQAFGSQAPGQERVIFGNQDSPPIQSDELTDNIDSNFLRGWGTLALGNKPPREWFNSVAFTATQLAAYLHQMGVAEYNGGQEYQIGSKVTGELSLLTSLVADNVGNELTDRDFWVPIGAVSFDTHSSLLAQAPTIDGTFYVSRERMNALYRLMPSSYVALPGDVTFNNGRVGRLEYDVADIGLFGAKYSNVVDDTQAALDAVARVSADGGGVVRYSGFSVHTAPIAVTTDEVMIEGVGMYNSGVIRGSDYGDTFVFSGNGIGAGDGSAQVLRFTGIRNLSVFYNGASTSGAAIRISGVEYYVVSNVYIRRGFIGILSEAATQVLWDNVIIINDNNFGQSNTNRRFVSFTFNNDYPIPDCGDVYINNFNWRGSNSANVAVSDGITIDSSDGIWFSNGHCNIVDNNILNLTANNSLEIGLLKFNNVIFDNGATNAVRFAGDTSVGRNIYFDNCHFKGGADCDHGVLTDGVASFYNVQFNDCTFSEYIVNAFRIQSPNIRLKLSNPTINSISINSPGTNPAILLNNVVNLSIKGGSIGWFNVDDVQQTQSFAIQHVGTCEGLIYEGVDLRGNINGPISGGVGQYIEKDCIIDEAFTSVASSATVVLPGADDFFEITGTTNINNLQASFKRRIVTLLFEDALTVSDAGNILLDAPLTTSASTALMLICDGTNWRQLK